MNIEEVAHETPEAIITEPVDIIKGWFHAVLVIGKNLFTALT